MNNVLTLIGNPEARDLGAEIAERSSSALQAAGAVIDRIDWLAPGLALDVTFTGPSPAAAEARVRADLGAARLDIVAQVHEKRRKGLLIADMDSTIINVECIDEVADFAGRRDDVARLTARAMRGEIDFADALRERTALFAGFAASELEDVYQARVKLNPGARELVATMRDRGAFTALISGGFSFFTERVAQAARFHHHRANELEIVDGRLTGRVKEPVLGANSKLAALHELAAERELPLGDTLAVGDGANDIAMLQAAGLGVAFHAKPKAAAAAAARIDHGDLTALLYIQGYRESEIVN